jgi:hypothetical protein
VDDVKVIEEPQLEIKRKLPWFIDVLLYPAGLHGIIQIGIFFFLSLLIGLLGWFASLFLRHYGSVIILFLHILLIGYITFYFGYCIFDSSKGGRRAPVIRSEHIPDKEDYISQLLLMLGCVAVCFWPIGVYYAFARRTDSIFWALAGCGGFFFPMALLRGVLFDAFDALNPISIIGSIFRTFLSYCGLILSFCVFGGLVAAIVFFLRRLPVLGFISNAVNLYLLFVAAHLLGRFYWWHKDKLDWGL